MTLCTIRELGRGSRFGFDGGGFLQTRPRFLERVLAGRGGGLAVLGGNLPAIPAGREESENIEGS